MPLYLDGEQLPGFDHRVTALGQIERADLSGESSATLSAPAGRARRVEALGAKREPCGAAGRGAPGHRRLGTFG